MKSAVRYLALGLLAMLACRKEPTKPATPVTSIDTIAGNVSFSGCFDAPTGKDARFTAPRGIAVSSQGNIYIADYGCNNVRLIESSGTIKSASVSWVLSVAIGPNGMVYVGSNGNTPLKKFTPDLTTAAIVDLGAFSGQVSSIVFDSQNNLFFSSSPESKIYKLTPGGTLTVFAGSVNGYQDGVGATARFDGPNGLAIDGQDNIYVCEPVANTGARIRKITRTGAVSTFAGGQAGFADGVGAAAKFQYPNTLTVAPDGMIYVADRGAIRRITPSGEVTTVIGNGNPTAVQDGPVATARVGYTSGIAPSFSSTDLYVTDGTSLRRISFQ